MAKKTRLIAVVLSAAVVFAVLFSLFFAAHAAGHDCVGAGCPVCAQLSVCRNVLETLFCTASAAVAAVSAGVLFRLPRRTIYSVGAETPISLKVKLLN